MHFQPRFVDRGGDRRVAAVSETGQPVRGIAEHRRLVVAGNRQSRLLEQEAGAFQ